MCEQFKFALYRCVNAQDEEVAQGVVFFSGKVVLTLVSDQSILIYDNLPAMCRAHCQDGKTRLLWGYSEIAHSQALLPSLV